MYASHNRFLVNFLIWLNSLTRWFKVLAEVLTEKHFNKEHCVPLNKHGMHLTNYLASPLPPVTCTSPGQLPTLSSTGCSVGTLI